MNRRKSLRYIFFGAFTITIQKLRLKMFLRFTSKQTYRIVLFLYILFPIHHSLRCGYFLFKVKSGSCKISILLFSRIFVYRCHGNIDFYKMKTTLKFNPKPTSIANFKLIRQGEDCLRADSKS